MRKSRVNLPNRCYHLIVTADNREAFGGVRRSRAESRRPSRVAHRAFFLDDEERRDHPNSPRQKYALTKAGFERIRRVAPL